MQTTRVYDVPTRLFHWVFAGLFVGAFFIAKVLDDESAQFPYHMMMGMVMTVAVVFRVVWGFVGSRYARFSSFALKPSDLFSYFKALIGPKGLRFFGHNPASSWAALVMMGLTIGLGVSGLMMTRGVNKEVLEEVHELFANSFLLVVIAHVAGVVFHTIKHKDPIGLSMVTGAKRGFESSLGLARNHLGAGVLFLVIVGGSIFYLNQNYDPSKKSLNLMGTVLQLGENEKSDGQKGHQKDRDEKGEHKADDHDD